VHDSGVEAAYMRKRNRRPPCRKIVLKLPDLDHAKSAVQDGHEFLAPDDSVKANRGSEQYQVMNCSIANL
jgi:hypothetical protein